MVGAIHFYGRSTSKGKSCRRQANKIPGQVGGFRKRQVSRSEHERVANTWPEVETPGSSPTLMRQIYKTIWRIVFLVCFACLPVRAQDTQFIPEVDAYLKLNSVVRTYFQAKDDREGGDSTQLAIGPSVEFYLKPLLKLKHVTIFDLDDSKSRALVVEVGYRYIDEPNAPLENRMVLAVTSHFPLKADFLITDRNRADLDWKNGVFNYRYRNRLTLERTFAIHSYHLIPYVSAELFYESQYGKISTTSIYAGSLFPVGKHVEFNPYYEHDNDTNKHPNKQVNSVGLATYFFFSAEKK
jgi:Protein of unknown function (DUF2490)